ncbi:hypothetical protein R2R70_02080 [Cobetia sp. SIMBA_158]|uniref:hypothetical protein n=1 Tax=Cobetia sp. SIMBA_158 TaxID=3081617 RepID=UPI00398168D8
MKTKKLTEPQKKVLTSMIDFDQSYHDIARAGGNSATVTSLVLKGLAMETSKSVTSRKWSITDKGRQALKDGRYTV